MTAISADQSVRTAVRERLRKSKIATAGMLLLVAAITAFDLVPDA